MGAFDGVTPKRHKLWSNDRSLLQQVVDKGGSMTKLAMQSLPGKALVKKYIDKRGQRRHVGIPDRLKKSQLHGCILNDKMLLNKS